MKKMEACTKLMRMHVSACMRVCACCRARVRAFSSRY